MANKGAKKPPEPVKPVKVSTNVSRRNGKAWKIRPCGNRHAHNDTCTACVKATTPSPYQALKASVRAGVRADREVINRQNAAARGREREAANRRVASTVRDGVKAD